MPWAIILHWNVNPNSARRPVLPHCSVILLYTPIPPLLRICIELKLTQLYPTGCGLYFLRASNPYPPIHRYPPYPASRLTTTFTSAKFQNEETSSRSYRGSTRVWAGDNPICSRMLYHWAMPPVYKEWSNHYVWHLFCFSFLGLHEKKRESQLAQFQI